MISQKKAMEAAQNIVNFCKQQRGCQNCIFREYGTDHWECNIKSYELEEVLRNVEAKKKNNGYI